MVSVIWSVIKIMCVTKGKLKYVDHCLLLFLVLTVQAHSEDHENKSPTFPDNVNFIFRCMCFT